MTNNHKINKQLNKIEQFIEEHTLVKKRILSLKEAASYTGISKSTLYKMVSDRRIKHYKPAKNIFFKREDLDSYMLSIEVPVLGDLM